MRLGIRRKLIGTLMLVGLFPLAMSLIVILGGGAAMQLSRIRNNYEETAASCADRIAETLVNDELEKLMLLTRLPPLVAYIREHNPPGLLDKPLSSEPPLPNDTAKALDAKWPSLKMTDAPLNDILNNRVAERLRLLAGLDGHQRELQVTNMAGELIAADVKTDDFFQADEKWWITSYSRGEGRVYISSVVPNPTTHEPVIEMVLPIFDDSTGHPQIVGILKEKLDVRWALAALEEQLLKRISGATAQLIDLDRGVAVYNPHPLPSDQHAAAFFLSHREDTHIQLTTLLFNDLVIGSEPVPLQAKIAKDFSNAILPRWVVVVSKPSEQAMVPVYKLALTVACIGIALIIVLFVLGVAISNREVIMPIIRLREATAAVGRGELNVRLLSQDAEDKTFQGDEIGELARDFDEMTRQLQRNVNALARSNEAKRRFMELAGHELRTPVTYIIGVCQLAQRQLQQVMAADPTEPKKDIAPNVQAAMNKISAKTLRLTRIIDNLLKLVTNDQFTTRLNKEPVDIGTLITQVCADHKAFIAERQQNLVLDIAPGLPPIEADRDKLEDALTNLVSNAIRFSPNAGTIRIAAAEVSAASDGITTSPNIPSHLQMPGSLANTPNTTLDSRMLEILIEDSGPGIPAADLAHLFEPFYTGTDILHHHSGTFEYGSKGIGLGLAIVRRFVELHGGIVRARPLITSGTTTGTQFQLLLPLHSQ